MQIPQPRKQEQQSRVHYAVQQPRVAFRPSCTDCARKPPHGRREIPPTAPTVLDILIIFDAVPSVFFIIVRWRFMGRMGVCNLRVQSAASRTVGLAYYYRCVKVHCVHTLSSRNGR